MAFDEGASTSWDGDEIRASRMIEQEMESMRQSIEELEDAAVLMRQALEHPTSSHVPVIREAEHLIENVVKPKKEKKSKRSKLGKRHASSPSLMVHQIPDESALQPLSTTKIKHSIGKSACPTKHKPFSSKHLRDDSSSTIVPSVAESQAGGSDGASPLENGNSKTGRMKRSHSHSGAKLFEQLFHKRSLHRSGHRNTISVPNPAQALSIHSAPATPMVPSSSGISGLEPSEFPILNPLSILADMEIHIRDLRHQHSSMLRLLPLSIQPSSRSGTLTSSQSSTISQGDSDRDHFGTPTQGTSRRPSLSSEMVSPKAVSSGADGLPPEMQLKEALGAGTRHTHEQAETAPKNRHHHHRTSTAEPQHHRRINHKARSSLSSMYAEVASIYYDADLGDDLEEPPSTPIQNGHYPNRNSIHDADEIERALQREVSRHSEHSHSGIIHMNTHRTTPAAGQGSATGTTVPQAYTGPIVRRKALPAPAPKAEPSLISMLKKNVGKDMSTIAFDVTFNEPISLLQKLAEEVEYFDLLRLANLAIDSIERLAHVAAFAVSQYASAKYRTVRKPFNPLQGETYELYREDLGLRFISEKVTHHPPRFAAKADGKGWNYSCTSAGKNRLAGMSLEIQPLGAQHVTLEDRGERYTWTKPLSYMRNLIAGTKYLETIGEMVVTNKTNGEKCVITFKDAGWSGSTRNHVTGICYKADGKTKAAWIDGVWDSHLDVRYGGPKDPAHPLWIVHPWPPKPELNYGFTKWAIELNELTPDLVGVIAPSDSRLRPDQRLLEEGHFTEADHLKAQLEEIQRKRRNEGHEVQPRWFKSAGPADAEWAYAGGYWEARETHTLDKKAVPFLFDT